MGYSEGIEIIQNNFKINQKSAFDGHCGYSFRNRNRSKMGFLNDFR